MHEGLGSALGSAQVDLRVNINTGKQITVADAEVVLDTILDRRNLDQGRLEGAGDSSLVEACLMSGSAGVDDRYRHGFVQSLKLIIINISQFKY